jgi:hypothetical protein
MAQVEPATPGGGAGPNRLFIIIALGLVGLLILGVIAAGAIFLLPQVFRTAAVNTPTVVVKITTPTRALPTALPTATATDTPLPTATIVVQAPTVSSAAAGATGTVTTTAAVTNTVGPGTGTPTGGLPKTGLGEDLLLLAGGVVLVLVIVAARRARAPGAA